MRACPFCNYDEGWIKEVPEKGRILYRVECKICGSTGPKATSHKMAEWKWSGLLSKVSNIKDHIEDEEGLDETADPYDELYMSENIGAPISTLVNTPGVGDATPAPQAAVTSSDMNNPDVKGSGDKWDNSKPKKKRKKRKSNSKN